ncbi:MULTISPECIES: TIM barrel protein [unclassified Chelatococcus]|uniref:sugar phosphate isomerase/epimerase family protein n=1 Tax=unclassified Chelatococcus TaxID=2638111 RepID=UPI001BCD5F33|nr:MULTISPECIES: TIM barrel protein [unclassified Chelatococcus]CAH1648445.1 Sugar phosphate isomerase/epimerase [Hyphomicrobiales bacterium]MBS7741942.1 TIM barrel protein [Chelatococcus sp. HY11]MBX3541260.1 TIM barrel protein [Chelatococcus sp.]MCO5074847.1 sugar phosphate isomerase/epimerase [Chelatococcus sp.]CAH1691018.1 Sugar phosphate isomerase/epimerase [Hyphomicrobiales bacterium]
MPNSTESSPPYATAFSSLGCPELEIGAVAALARRYGIAMIELRALGGGTDLPAYFSARFGTPEKLRVASADFAVPVAALGTSLRLIGNNKSDLIDFRRYIPWAQALGAPHLRVFDGGRAGDEQEFEQAGETLAWWRAESAALDPPVDIIVETHDSLAEPAALETFVARHPCCKLLWDTHHTWRRSGEAPSRTWARIGEAVVHMHVKDSVAAPDTRHGYRYVPLGAGEFPLSDLQDVLRHSQFSGVVSLEWERLWHPALAPLDAVLPDFGSLLAA